MVHSRMDDKKTDRQRDKDYEAKTVDVNSWSVYFLWICNDQKYFGVPIWIRLFGRPHSLHKI